jgi:hypothetical protein
MAVPEGNQITNWLFGKSFTHKVTNRRETARSACDLRDAGKVRIFASPGADASAQNLKPKLENVAMKKLFVAATLALATAGAASAMTSPLPISAATKSEVMRLVPGADLSGISAAQAARLSYVIVNSGAELTNDIDKRNVIRNILKKG